MARATDPCTTTLVRFVCRTSLEDVPESVRNRAKLHLLDTIGCALGGSRTDIGRTALAALLDESTGRATCLGHERRIGPRDAALLNGVLANALDYDDDNGVGHPSATVLPAALAVAEERGASGRDLLLAYVLGYEISSRVGRAIWPSPERYQDVWGVGTHQVFGAVTAAAKLGGLDESQTLHAFGIAGSAASVPSALKWNWDARPLAWVKDAVAWPAQNGLMSASLARKGFVGCRDILDGPRGFWIMAGSDRFDRDVLTDGLGDRYFAGESATKPYPSCRFSHSTLEAVERLVHDHGFPAHEVDSVTVRSVSDVVEYLSDPSPTSSVDAQFSASFTAALVLLGIPPGPDWFSREVLESDRVRQLARRVRLIADPEADRAFQEDVTSIPAEVTVRLRDGRQLSERVTFPRGERQNPIPDAAVRSKFTSLAAPVIGDRAADVVMTLVGDLERLALVDELTAHLRPGG